MGRENRGVRGLREAVHQFGMFLQRMDHSQIISIQMAGARPRGLDVRSETKRRGGRRREAGDREGKSLSF